MHDRRTKAEEKKTSSEGSDKRQLAKHSSADHSERPIDCTFTEADTENPFHLWYRVNLTIDGDQYKSAGHYLVTKSLGR